MNVLPSLLVVSFFGTLVLLILNRSGAISNLLRITGLYDIVDERRCHVYMLFGKVVGMIDEPGLHILPIKLGLRAFLRAGAPPAESVLPLYLQEPLAVKKGEGVRGG